jgi:hypothetical protein
MIRNAQWKQLNEINQRLGFVKKKNELKRLGETLMKGIIEGNAKMIRLTNGINSRELEWDKWLRAEEKDERAKNNGCVE